MLTCRASAARGFMAVSADVLKLLNKLKHHFIKNAFYGDVEPDGQSTIEKMLKKVVSARFVVSLHVKSA